MKLTSLDFAIRASISEDVYAVVDKQVSPQVYGLCVRVKSRTRSRLNPTLTPLFAKVISALIGESTGNNG
jgi:hypothetical protein